MIRAFLTFLGGNSGEEREMTFLLGKGFFMGILLATYQISSETLFLSVLGDEWLDVAFFTAGGVGVIATGLFVFLQKKINFSSLVLSTTFLTLLFVWSIRIAFEFIAYDSSRVGEFQILPFILFVMLGPITSFILLGFWGIFGRIFDLKQSKRIIGGIDTGQLMATMIAFFSIPILTTTIINTTYDLLLVSGFAALGVFIFTLLLTLRFNLDRVTKLDRGEKLKPVGFGSLFKDKYLRLLSVFLIFSMGVSKFVDLTFLSATETMYPNEKELSTFLSFFSGTVIIVSFLIQSFVNDIIIGRFGLKVALMTMPLILGLFIVGAIVAGHIFEYEIKSQEFILFFVLTAVGKLFTTSLKDALENPAYKLFFLPLDIKIRFDIQTRIEGVVNEIAVLIAGATQIALGLLVFFKLIHYSYFILLLAGGVVYLASKLFEEYKKTLKTTLKRHIDKEDLGERNKRNENNIILILKNEIQKKDTRKVINALKILEKLEPIEFEYVLLDLLNVRYPILRRYAYRKLGERLCCEALKTIEKDIKTEGNELVMQVADRTFAMLEKAQAFKLTDASIKKMVRSTEAKNRIRGAQILAKISKEKHLGYLIELLRDINPQVRTAAIITAGKIKNPELWPVLIQNLHLAAYSNAAMSALKSIGKSAFQTIDAAFYKTGQHHSTMVRIIQILGRIGGRDATELLWKKMDFPDRKIASQLLLSLSHTGFIGRNFQGARIKMAVESVIGDIAWNMKATLQIPHKNMTDRMIREAMIEEDRKNYENIFILLSMIYDPQSVELAKESIQSGTSESITFAVEMMDIFVEEELKPKLLPVMEELKVNERLNRLQNYYPPEHFESYQDMLLQIINRDYNRINRYTKALAMYRISQITNEITPDIIANLFNPDPLLLQTAAYVLYKQNESAYHQHTKRLKATVKKELDKTILPPIFRHEDEDYHQRLLLIERILLLKRLDMFNPIPGELIVSMAECFEEEKIKMGTNIVTEGDSGIMSVYVVLEGVVDMYKSHKLIGEARKDDVFGEKNLLETDKYKFTALARNECTLLFIRREQLFNLMSNHIELVDRWIDILNDEKQERESEKIVDVLFG